MKYAFVNLNWNTVLHVPVSELSKLLEMLGKFKQVQTTFDGDEYYCYLSKDRAPTIELTDLVPEPKMRVKADESTAVSVVA